MTRHIEGIDHETWWRSLDLPVRRDLEDARRREATDRRNNEVRDYIVTQTYTELAANQGVDGGDAPVVYAIRHPRRGEGFECEAEALTFLLELEAAEDRNRAAGFDRQMIVDITRRVRWKDGDKLRDGTHVGLPHTEADLIPRERFVSLLHAFRARTSG